MTFEVELQMFQKGAIRKVVVPDEELTGDLVHDLNRIYYYGQNDFQNDPEHCSVSAGDIVRYHGVRYLLSPKGALPITTNGGQLSNDPAKKLQQLLPDDKRD
jgi:hypothetical protein